MQEKSSGFQWPAQWTPDILATLMFVVQKGRILLIRKKRGIGAGKVNGPGGKFEPGETALQCVLREVREELHIDIEDAREMGVLNFSFSRKAVAFYASLSLPVYISPEGLLSTFAKACMTS